MRIHFICRGNVFRSKIAEAYTKSLKIRGLRVISSGTVARLHGKKNESIDGDIFRLLKKHGIAEYRKRRWAQLTQKRIGNNDIVVCMNKRVFSEARKIVKLPKQVHIWNITDIGEAKPVPHGAKKLHTFLEMTYQKITHHTDELVEDLMKSKQLSSS